MIDLHPTLSPYPANVDLRRFAEEQLCYCGCMLAYYSLGHPEPHDVERVSHPAASWRPPLNHSPARDDAS